MVFWIVLFVLISLVLAAAYTRLTYMASPQVKLLSKTLASLSFVVLGLLCASFVGKTAYGTLVCLGLIFGALGDALLEMTECRPDRKNGFFLAGIAAFLLGHLMYIPAFLTAVHARVSQFVLGLILLFTLRGEAISFVGFVLIGLALICWSISSKVILLAKIWHADFPLGRSQWPVYLYGAIVALMAGCAICSAFISASVRSVLMLLGGALFLISDTFLLIRLFSPYKKWWFGMVVLATYYPAQILLALSILAV